MDSQAFRRAVGHLPGYLAKTTTPRLMSLFIECDRLISDGMIKNQSELAHYAQVTTARMTHIMWLTNLAPEIQEAILFLPRAESGPDTVKEVDVRRIARVMDWGVQRGMREQTVGFVTTTSIHASVGGA